MAYRLRIADAGGGRRALLRPGENLVGARPGCDVAIVHPSVSRDHAVIVWGGGRVTIADLGSSNGTFLEGRRISSSEELRPGGRVTFGTVEATLEEVADADAEPAPLTPWSALTSPAAAEASPAPAPESRRTASVGPVPQFALGHLPRLLGALRRGRGRGEMALLVGEAVVGSLACRGLEVTALGAGEAAAEAVLFRWGTVDTDERPVTVGEGGPVVLRATFASSAESSLLRPLLAVAHELLLLAPVETTPATADDTGVDTAGESDPVAGGEGPPPLPEPPTLDPGVREIYERAAVIAASDVHVLIRGESGTGKEVLARFLHAHATDPRRPFVTLNCAALPRDLLEAELFGIDKGVATGVAARPGKFELAHGGTLFLDEIGDMSPETQAKILRVLQEGEVLRLGAREPRPARVRVVSATNRDLDALRRDGAFRDDLYHRIADWEVELPPLRERAVDIPQLAAYFLAQETRRSGRRVAGLSRGAVDALVGYDWPGNVRQLEREVRRAVLFVGDGELLDTSRLSAAVRAAAGGRGRTLQEQLGRHERRVIEGALAATGGDVPAAAEALDVPVSTFYRKLKKLGVEPAS